MKTGKYVERITPLGIIEPKTTREMKRYSQISVNKYGSSFLLYSISRDIIAFLSDNFPEWKELFIFASMRLMHISLMKNVEFYYSTSFFSELIKDTHVLSMGDNIISATLGYTSMEEYFLQVQLLFLFPPGNSMPYISVHFQCL